MIISFSSAETMLKKTCLTQATLAQGTAEQRVHQSRNCVLKLRYHDLLLVAIHCKTTPISSKSKTRGKATHDAHDELLPMLTPRV